MTMRRGHGSPAVSGFAVDSLSGPWRELGVNVDVIGDAFAARSLQHAILDGHKCGREI